MNLPSPHPHQPLKDALLQRIEEDNVCPHSRLFFRSRECFVWSLWLISVVIGAFAVAISLFVVTHRQYELYEATHENFFTFIVEALPYLWLITFGVMAYAAIYNLRHTKHGYRYPVSVIILSSAVLSFAGGSTLQMFGFGYSVDDLLGKNMDMYMSQSKLEQKLWQVPEEGRLLGQQVVQTVEPTIVVVFKDISGQRWRLDVSDLSERDLELLASRNQVRLLGTTTDSTLRTFHACGAFPWMVEPKVTRQQMIHERDEFIKKVYSHMHASADLVPHRDFGEPQSGEVKPVESLCSSIAAVRRMPLPQ